jgi:hypothetical protein
MKRKLLISTLLIILLFNYSNAFPVCNTFQNNPENGEDIKNVKNAVVESYVQGIFLQGNAKLLKKGWHPESEIIIFINDGIKKLPIKYWVERLEKNPKPLDPNVTYNFIDVRIVGHAAVAIIEIFSNGEQLYTDYLCLYKFNDGWKIVTKIYYELPKQIV